MALICPACNASNRDSAKFCRSCAHQLFEFQSTAPNSKPARTSSRKRKRRKKAPEPSHQGLIWTVVLVFALLALAAALWRWGTQQRNTPPEPAATPETTLARPRAPESEALEHAQQALRELEVEAAARAAEREAESARLAAEAEQQAQAAKAAARAAPATPPQGPAASNESGITETVERLAPQPDPEPAPQAAPAPEPAGSLCAGVGVIARAVCLQNECRKPALAQHPQCVHMRELQQSLQQSAGGG